MTDNNIMIPVPEMTIEQYAQHVGVSNRTVEEWIAKNHIPSIKIGRRRLVNVLARAQECKEALA